MIYSNQNGQCKFFRPALEVVDHDLCPGSTGSWLSFLTWTDVVLPPQLDCDEDSPNFDEDGRDEYNEIHMLV